MSTTARHPLSMNTAGPLVASGTSTLVGRFLRKGWTVTSEGCWEWNGSRRPDENGYGQIGAAKTKIISCHRLAYELFVGDIPRGAHVLHSCDNPPCVNPAHLKAGTHEENMAEAEERGRRMVAHRHPRAKLTWELVNEIRSSNETPQQLADRMGVSRATVHQVIKYKTWRDKHRPKPTTRWAA